MLFVITVNATLVSVVSIFVVVVIFFVVDWCNSVDQSEFKTDREWVGGG